MKSKRAADHIGMLTYEQENGSRKEYFVTTEVARMAVVIAEQDARDRAIDSIKLVLETINTVDHMSELDKCYLLGVFSNNYDK